MFSHDNVFSLAVKAYTNQLSEEFLNHQLGRFHDCMKLQAVPYLSDAVCCLTLRLACKESPAQLLAGQSLLEAVKL